MAPPRATSRGVYVSNIPYEMTEEQLTHVMSEVGPVQQTRLAFHADTGRAKGFGFVDYYDSETAASAVRNLSGRPLPAPFNRALTITFQQADLPPSGSSHPSSLNGAGIGAADDPRTLLTQPPRGRMPDPGVRPTDAITQTLAAVPSGQLEEVLGRMKGLIESSPQEARHLLTAQPQLAYALFQSLLMMDLVDPAVIARMTTTTTAGPAVGGGGVYGGPAGGLPPPPLPAAGGSRTYGAPFQQQPGPAPSGPRSGVTGHPPSSSASAGRPPLPSSSQPALQASTSARTYPSYSTPPSIAPVPGVGGGSAAAAAGPINPALAALPPDQQAMLAQVLAMTADQIGGLPEEQRRSVLLLRSQFGA